MNDPPIPPKQTKRGLQSPQPLREVETDKPTNSRPILMKSEQECPSCGKRMLASSPTSFQCEACGCTMGAAAASNGIRKELPQHVLDIFPDRKVAQYVITDVLGHGGQGLALELERDGRQYVGKVIDHRLSLAPYTRPGRGAVRGSEVLKHLHHPGIPKAVEDLDMPERRCSIFIREKAHGRSLREIIDEGTLDNQKTVAVMRGVLDILQYTHDAGLHPKVGQVIHRDIKPGNIILGDERTSLIDFDTSKFGSRATTMTSVGTFDYQPLEQVLGTATPASDIYALGATCIEALLGEVPDVLKQSRMPGSKPYQLPTHISAQLRKILEKMVRPDAAERYQSAQDILHDLNKMASATTGLVPTTGNMRVSEVRVVDGVAKEFPLEIHGRIDYLRENVRMLTQDVGSAYSEKIVFGVMSGLGAMAASIGAFSEVKLAVLLGGFAAVGGAARYLGAFLKERDKRRKLVDDRLELAWREEPDPEIRQLRKQIWDARQDYHYQKKSIRYNSGDLRLIDAKISELEAKIQDLQPRGYWRTLQPEAKPVFFYADRESYERDAVRVASRYPDQSDIYLVLQTSEIFGTGLIIETSVECNNGRMEIRFERTPHSGDATVSVRRETLGGIFHEHVTGNTFAATHREGYTGLLSEEEARSAYTAFHEKIEKEAPDLYRIMYAQVDDNRTYISDRSLAGPFTGGGI